MSSRVSAIFRYPLKSGARETLTDACFTSRGIPLDREFMVTKVSDGAERLCTQRDIGKEKLSQIKLVIASSGLSLHAPGMEELRLPPLPANPEIRKVLVHSQETEGIDQGDEASSWLNEYLGTYKGTALRLVRQNEQFIRRPHPHYVTHTDARTAFADGYPILIVSDESLKEVLSLMREMGGSGSLPSLRDRVRANLYVSGFGAPFLEERIKRIRIGDTVLELVKPCSRCPIPSINQSTGVRDEEGRSFSVALGKFRRGSEIGLSSLFPSLSSAELNQTYIGMNAVVVSQGSSKVGIADPLEVLEMRENLRS